MRSRVIRLLPKTDYSFSGLQAGTTVSDLPLVQNIDVGAWAGGVLMVRVHAVTLQTDSYFRVDARVVGPTDDDPRTTFQERTVGTVVGHQSSVTAPSLLRGRLAAGMGAFVSLFLTVYQDKVGTCTFTISVDLLLEDRGDDWTPRALGSKLRVWLDERDLPIVSGAYAAWGDQSTGGANDFQQGTASLRPVPGRLVNYWNAPDFDGANDYLAADELEDIITATAYHVFVVLRVDTVTGTNSTVYHNHGVVADAGTGWWGLYLKANGSKMSVHGFHWAGATRQAIISEAPLGTDLLVEWSYDGTTIRCRIGNGPIATAAGGGTIGNLLGVPQLGFGATGGLYFDGCIASAVVCNQYLPAEDARRVRDYLSSKYGVGA